MTEEYKLVLAEKPSVANSIADVLGADERRDGYREGNGYRVTWCVGHLVELCQPESYGEQYGKWAMNTLPIIPDKWKYQVKKDVAKQFKIVKALMDSDEVTSVVEATDAGREGELIFRLTYDKAGCRKPFERLWISSMEESAIREGFKNLKPGSDYDRLYDSALARQQADWLMGINGTRLFTLKYRGRVLKVGRVQTPTLAMIVERDREITEFKKSPYYTAVIHMGNIKAGSEKITDKDEAARCAFSCRNGTAEVVKIEKEITMEPAPRLYDLTSLQRDANRIFGMTAKETLDCAQSLYEKKMLTYPRTDSQYLSDDMAETAEKVLKMTEGIVPFMIPFDNDGMGGAFGHDDQKKYDVSGILDSSKVSDHHAIIPTLTAGEKENRDAMSLKEGKVFWLVCCRLFEAVSEDHVFSTDKIGFMVNEYKFFLKVKNIRNNGWKHYSECLKEYYSVNKSKKTSGRSGAESESEDENSDGTMFEIEGKMSFEKGMKLRIDGSEVREGFTKAPPQYTEGTLLAAMERAGAKEMDDDVERKGLGTPATRADIIEKLVTDGFVARFRKHLIPTDIGKSLIKILPENVKSPQLTADWENRLVQVSKGEMPKNKFMEDIVRMVDDLVKDNAATESAPDGNPFENVMGKCPKCGGDVVKGKYGPYCGNRCGMFFGRALGVKLDETQIQGLLDGKQILVKDIRSKTGSTYDALLKPNGTREFSYTDREGNEKNGFEYSFEISFPEKKK